MIGSRRPRVDGNALRNADHKEFDALVANNLKVDGALQIADVHPPVSLFRLLKALGAEDLLLQPRQIVDTNSPLAAAYRNQNVLALQNSHLIKAASSDQMVD